MEVKVHAERTSEGWSAEVAGPDGFTVTAKRLDQCKEAELPGIICDLEAAKVKMQEAQKLQEEASSEIRNVVGRMRDEGLTMRDIAVLLGVSPQRVAQLID